MMWKLLGRHNVRKLCTSSRCLKEDYTRVPLSTPIAGNFVQKQIGSTPIYTPFNTEITKLANGMTVASETHYGDYCTIGLCINSGARYEVGFPFGTSHLVEKLAFGSTSTHNSRDEIYGVLERNGGLIDCQSTKDSFIYAASCHVSGVDPVMQVLANAVWRPNITEDEFNEANMIATFENEDLARKIECEPLITDWIHTAAFKGNTLGFSKFTSDDSVAKITREHVFTYLSQYHTPERIVVSGVGVPHHELVASVQKYFDESTTTWAQDPKLLLAKPPPVDNSVAQYTGGSVLHEKDLKLLAVGTPYPNLAHVSLGFEGAGYKDEDFVAFCVMQSLLGGGGSFSAGGPGKGMYTRLYTEVMNRYHWVYSAQAYNHSYADAGLFCVHGSTDPEQINDLLRVILYQFILLTKGVEKEELDRARVQLKSQLMMNLEVRPVMFEDLARQIIGHGYRRRPDEYMQQIDSVTNDDIKQIAERMLTSRPSLVGYGEIKKLASYEQLHDAVAHRLVDRLLPQKKIFSWQ